MEATNLLACLRDAVGQVVELDRTMDFNRLVLERDSEGLNTLTLVLCALEDTSDGTGAATAGHLDLVLVGVRLFPGIQST